MIRYAKKKSDIVSRIVSPKTPFTSQDIYMHRTTTKFGGRPGMGMGMGMGGGGMHHHGMFRDDVNL